VTIGEEMALDVLKGDTVRAYVLAEQLLKDRDSSRSAQAEAAKILRTKHQGVNDGYEVYRWPEFQAFCKRAGILWDLLTIGMVIHVNVGEMLKVEHTYKGIDTEDKRDVGS
jgi:hypothetical protein